MTTFDPSGHWQGVYTTKAETEVSWFQAAPAPSLELLRQAQQAALDMARARLGEAGARVTWIAGDATEWTPAKAYDAWHDRAAFHFLTEAADRVAYLERLRRALRVGGVAIFGGFAPDGPEKCSGLPVMRQDAASLAASLSAALGPGFDLLDERRHDHRTPGGATQKFQFSTFRRVA